MSNSGKENAPAETEGANQKTQEKSYNKSGFSQAKIALNEAIKLADIDIPVFPCLENKAPTCEGGFKIASCDLEVIRSMWNSNAVLVGVPTGISSGIDVLDIDPRHAGDVWLDANIDRLPVTRIHETRSGGKHIFFRHHEGMRNSAGKIASGVDIRADGGYIIWWPAAAFKVLNDVPLADWPEWLFEALKPAPRTPFVPDVSFAADSNVYAAAALRKAAFSVATAAEGQRNDTLNREAWSLLRFSKSGELSIQDIMNTLASAALSSGLARSEVLATLISAMSARGIV